jgi:hypothetical protein
MGALPVALKAPAKTRRGAAALTRMCQDGARVFSTACKSGSAERLTGGHIRTVSTRTNRFPVGLARVVRREGIYGDGKEDFPDIMIDKPFFPMPCSPWRATCSGRHLQFQDSQAGLSPSC